MEDHGNTSDNMIDKIYLLEYNKIRREQIFYSHVICLDLLKQGFMPKSEAPMGASFFTYSHTFLDSTSDTLRRLHFPSTLDYPNTILRSFQCLLQIVN